MTLSTKKAICSIMKPKVKMLHFDFANFQVQANSYDCGMFAIAFATEIAHGHNPILAQFDVTKLREHLIECFEKGHLTRFPCTKQRRIPLSSRVQHYFQEPIYCVCRTVNDPSLPMIACDFCKEWFHYNCENVDPNHVDLLKSTKWKCSKCKALL